MTTETRRNQQFWDAFTCERCGKCCRQLGLPYDPCALPAMAAYLGISQDELVERYYGVRSADGHHLIMDETKRRPCPFLAEEGGLAHCTIYPVRPPGCRGYPFDTDFGRNGVNCPGAKKVFIKLGIEK